ncbi:Arc family DNA-binding protein [Pseudomonas sp. Fl5BN2]|uniref:Arc family DNA-binding protein n=1 Tax=Pseudomonas sp. Fl5BN2 TaxID=2697652 RepID=UPI001377F8E6|nr:Arc family DNA-binding protein [Pseudomonas sp. Fl5BN2]NBF04293.1 Arc family DNA-binding protein [Pseudomonas sp. Fl5BN2]
MHAPVQKFIVRLPDDLHSQVKSIAKEQNRSMNHEIVNRLEKSLVDDESRELSEKIVALLLQKVESLEQQLECLQPKNQEADL